MTERTCIIDGCDKPHEARDWCIKHYSLWRRHGSPVPRPNRTDLPGEHWLPVVGYESRYMVSDLGRVWRNARPGRGGTIGGFHKSNPNPSGYLYLVLRRGARSRTLSVHTLVAEAFHGSRPTGAQCRHLDGDPTNNAASNLRWGTPSENILDAVRHGTHHWAAKTHCPQGHPYDAENTVGTEQGVRRCRRCHNEISRAYWRRRRASTS